MARRIAGVLACGLVLCGPALAQSIQVVDDTKH